jgi:hypothetical protein
MGVATLRSRTQKLGEALRSRTQSCNHTAGEEARNRHELEFPFDLMVKFLYILYAAFDKTLFFRPCGDFLLFPHHSDFLERLKA